MCQCCGRDASFCSCERGLNRFVNLGALTSDLQPQLRNGPVPAPVNPAPIGSGPSAFSTCVTDGRSQLVMSSRLAALEPRCYGPYPLRAPAPSTLAPGPIRVNRRNSYTRPEPIVIVPIPEPSVIGSGASGPTLVSTTAATTTSSRSSTYVVPSSGSVASTSGTLRTRFVRIAPQPAGATSAPSNENWGVAASVPPHSTPAPPAAGSSSAENPHLTAILNDSDQDLEDCDLSDV
jgi:hypothetical protein